MKLGKWQHRSWYTGLLLHFASAFMFKNEEL
jgi:hypothetical protein